jgi:curved DNA-binding protein CbpA
MNTGELRDYYRILGVPQSATVSEIHKAYWQQASRCHPDKGGSHEAMVRLAEAWKILSDPGKRARYDQLFSYRHDGWRSRKFNNDVQEARKRAEGDSGRSWAEFEAIYQKAFYTFNQDFYGEDLEGKAAGPFSPLMGSNSKAARINSVSESASAERTLNSAGGTMFVFIMKSFVVFAAIIAAFLMYRNYSDSSRYVPLGQQDASSLLILDTTNGAVYSVNKRDGTRASPRQEAVSPFPREK